MADILVFYRVDTIFFLKLNTKTSNLKTKNKTKTKDPGLFQNSVKQILNTGDTESLNVYGLY